jgi:hypothetical protein
MMTDEEKEKEKQIVKRAFGIILTIALYLGVKFFVSETYIQVTKYTGWSKEYKAEFVNDCKEGIVKTLKDEHGIKDTTRGSNKGRAVNAVMTIYPREYCDCIAEKVEDSGILKTSYNKLRGVASTVEENQSAVAKYIESEKGT